MAGGFGTWGMKYRRATGGIARDEERRLGQAVSWTEGRPTKSARTEGAHEALHRRAPHRFRSVVRQPPGTQIKALAVFVAHAANAQVVGEVRSAAMRGAKARNSLEPAGWSLQERCGRHLNRWASAEHTLQHAVDQPHVVIDRQPRDR